MRSFAIIVALSIAFAACSGSRVKLAADPADPYHAYHKAMDDLISGDYTQAATQFEDLAASSINPLLSQMASLRLGDALFFQGRYAEAAEVYRQFLEQYARSADWPHAAYMRGLSFLRKMPEDHWVMPPAESREMSDADNAYQAFVKLIEGAPESFFAMRARLLLAQTVERRCRHHLYVASWYEKKDRPRGVAQRIEQAIADETSEKALGRIPASYYCADTPPVLLRLARAYDAENNGPGVRKTAARLAERANTTKVSASTLAEMNRLQEKYPPRNQ